MNKRLASIWKEARKEAKEDRKKKGHYDTCVDKAFHDRVTSKLLFWIMELEDKNEEG
jgi:hypothetical protein